MLFFPMAYFVLSDKFLNWKFLKSSKKQIKRGKIQKVQKNTKAKKFTERALLHHNARALANQIVCYISLTS